MSKLDKDLPPEVRDQSDLIADGLTDEIEALEEYAAAQDAQKKPGHREGDAPGGIPTSPSDQAEPAPETL